ncbi:hypothetical protein [Brevundimonas goettingensis]|uniref:Uncharacterized protein n=1 Tax=Brevundimonas goettingensis TaxID=2774190 RepID=A0A975C2V3_9CAUL|nr:hypothetical protein [Brevundimonas goettingensis]QTC92848.1 hypothetical protein IFJ75_08400 [Brevundimonas goettingensis]
MRTRETTVEDLEDFWTALQAPLGRALRDAWSILTERVEAQNRRVSDMPDQEMVELLCVAFREAAPIHYQHVDRDRLEAGLDELVATLRMEMAANTPSNETMN